MIAEVRKIAICFTRGPELALEIVGTFLPQSSHHLELRTSWALKTPFLTDVRAELGLGQSWNLFATSSLLKGSVDLKFNSLHSLHDSIGVVLLNISTGDIHHYKKAGGPASEISAYDWKSVAVADEFELAIGGSDYIQQRLLEFSRIVRTLRLGQNFRIIV